MVASVRVSIRSVTPGRVSIPFIAGQWSLPDGRVELLTDDANVSIPFIAGQWSLPPDTTRAAFELHESQSPSLRGSGRFGASRPSGWRMPPGLNPLHCGAVVASSGSP